MPRIFNAAPNLFLVALCCALCAAGQASAQAAGTSSTADTPTPQVQIKPARTYDSLSIALGMTAAEAIAAIKATAPDWNIQEKVFTNTDKTAQVDAKRESRPLQHSDELLIRFGQFTGKAYLVLRTTHYGPRERPLVNVTEQSLNEKYGPSALTSDQSAERILVWQSDTNEQFVRGDIALERFNCFARGQESVSKSAAVKQVAISHEGAVGIPKLFSTACGVSIGAVITKSSAQPDFMDTLTIRLLDDRPMVAELNELRERITSTQEQREKAAEVIKPQL